MSALDNQPENVNFLSPLGFKFQVKKLPITNFFIQQVSFPGLSINPVDFPNPFVKIPISGEHIDFDDLQISFKIDEDMRNYIELHNWLRGLGFPDDYSQYEQLENQPKMSGMGLVSDVSLLILSSSKNPTFDIVFRDAFPISLSGFTFDTTLQDVNYIEATATFRYTSYSINPIT
jgi:hypothetical protein